jgi:hypothetical protein
MQINLSTPEAAMTNFLSSLYKHIFPLTDKSNPIEQTATNQRPTLEQKVYARFHNHARRPYRCILVISTEIAELRHEYGYEAVEEAILKIAKRESVYGGVVYALMQPCNCTDFNEPRATKPQWL